jgi:hypothetical protein
MICVRRSIASIASIQDDRGVKIGGINGASLQPEPNDET